MKAHSENNEIDIDKCVAEMLYHFGWEFDGESPGDVDQIESLSLPDFLLGIDHNQWESTIQELIPAFWDADRDAFIRYLGHLDEQKSKIARATWSANEKNLLIMLLTEMKKHISSIDVNELSPGEKGQVIQLKKTMGLSQGQSPAIGGISLRNAVIRFYQLVESEKEESDIPKFKLKFQKAMPNGMTPVGTGKHGADLYPLNEVAKVALSVDPYDITTSQIIKQFELSKEIPRQTV